MAPHSERERSQSPSNASAENVDSTEGGLVQTDASQETNPFATLTSSSTNSSIGQAVSTDEAVSAVPWPTIQGPPYRPDPAAAHSSSALYLGSDPFASSEPSLADYNGIGRAFSTDDEAPIARGNTSGGAFWPGFEQGNPFRSSASSSDDGTRSRAMSDDDDAAVSFPSAAAADSMAGPRQETNPFAFSSFSMGDSSTIGRAVSLDEPAPLALRTPGRASHWSRASSGLRQLERRLNSSQQHADSAPVPAQGGAYSPAASMRARRRSSAVDPFAGPPGSRSSHANDQYTGRASYESELSGSGAPSRRRSSDIDPQAVSEEARTSTASSRAGGRPVAHYPRTRGRTRSSSIDSAAGNEASAGVTSSRTPSASPAARQAWNRRRSSAVDPFHSSEAAANIPNYLSGSVVPPIPGASNRRRSSAADPFASNEPFTGSSIPSLNPAARHISRLSAPNLPTPISEEPNPMEQAFGRVRFNPNTSTDAANVEGSGPSSGGRERRRQSSAVVGGRSGSFSGIWSRRFSRRESQIDPMDSTQRTVSTGAIPTAGERPAQGPQRSQSVAGEPSFTHPFQKGKGRLPASARRASDPLQRRPSALQRAMSMSGIGESPIPPRYRSRSVTSLTFFVTPMKRNNSVNPIFEEDIVAERENVREFLEAAKEIQKRDTRSKWQKELFRLAYFVVLLSLVYFVFVGRPLWPGIGSVYYDFMHVDSASRTGVVAAFIGWAFAQSALPLIFGRFETEVDDVESRDASETALIIPAYKAANVLPETIKAALQIFKKEQIYVIANGNAPEPMDNTADVCQAYGVNHAWVPIGSKITAEFVGVALTHKYKYIMLIDDDVHLPANLPLVTHRINDLTKCIGYTIKSTGANGARGTLIQQCQDMEYKASGMSRTFAGMYGSTTFPHGAIILWERECLQNLFNVHPGFVISEDWFFGHCARSSGHRIQFCSQVFVETETPPALFKSSSAARGGFGEMTVFKQRFYRWNYFLVHRLYDDGCYMLLSWRLGRYEIVTKFYVLIELYGSAMAILRPWICALTLASNPRLFFLMMAAMMGMYIGIFASFNAWHLRKKNEMVQWRIMPVYLGMKFCLLWVTVASVYYSIFHYALYFMSKHPRVIESTNALEAAYKVRLGTALVPLDKPASDATVGEVKEDRSSSHGTDSDSVEKKAQ